MSFGKATVTDVDNNQGAFAEHERAFLVVGETSISTNNGKIIAVSPNSDLVAICGANESRVKTCLEAMIANAEDENFRCYVLPIDETDNDLAEQLDKAFKAPNDLKIEGVVYTTALSDQQKITDFQTILSTAISKYAKRLSGHLCCPGIDVDTQTWSDYETATKAIITGLIADDISMTPLLHGNNLGVVMGRLCTRKATVADSPMRNNTGALIGLGSDPVDSNGAALELALLESLSLARFSVPQWYADYDGKYWADHMMLTTETSDYKVFENRRVMNRLLRRVRLLAISKIADRSFNSTPKSIAFHQTFFNRPLREDSKSIKIGEREHPGLIQPPKDKAVNIVWETKYKVSLSLTATPYNSPKEITAYISLDLKNLGE